MISMLRTGGGHHEIEQRLMHLGDELPKAEIIGTDLSPTQSKWYVELKKDDATS